MEYGDRGGGQDDGGTLNGLKKECQVMATEYSGNDGKKKDKSLEGLRGVRLCYT